MSYIEILDYCAMLCRCQDYHKMEKVVVTKGMNRYETR